MVWRYLTEDLHGFLSTPWLQIALVLISVICGALVGALAWLVFVGSTRSEERFRFVVWGNATDLLPYVVTNAAQIRQLSVPPNFPLFAGDLPQHLKSPGIISRHSC